MNRSLIEVIALLMTLVAVASAMAVMDDNPVQRAALIALYDNINGPNWLRNNGWIGSSSIL